MAGDLLAWMKGRCLECGLQARSPSGSATRCCTVPASSCTRPRRRPFASQRAGRPDELVASFRDSCPLESRFKFGVVVVIHHVSGLDRARSAKGEKLGFVGVVLRWSGDGKLLASF